MADVLAPVLDAEMARWGVDTLLRRAHFLGQACWESAYFSRLEENLHYTHSAAIAAVWPRLAERADDLVGNPVALANAAYAGANGNGDEASGDGWRYRGRGLFGLTGRGNYLAAGKALGLDLEAGPDQAAEPHNAVLTALWFWKWRGCSELADTKDGYLVTRRINGGVNGVQQREALTNQALTIFT
jgi:putative chitinase